MGHCYDLEINMQEITICQMHLIQRRSGQRGKLLCSNA